MAEKVEADDYEKLAKELQNASPLEIMDKALEKFGNDIAIAFRYFAILSNPIVTAVFNMDGLKFHYCWKNILCLGSIWFVVPVVPFRVCEKTNC